MDIKDFDGKMKTLMAFERLLVTGDEVYVMGSLHTVDGRKEIFSSFFNHLIMSQLEEGALINLLRYEALKNFGRGVLLAILMIVWFLLYS